MTFQPDDISFAVTLDNGALAEQGLILIRSLRAVYPDAPILAYITCEADSIDRSIYDEVQETTTVEHGDLPIEAYPNTAYQASFIRAAERFDTTYTAAIDTDCVVFNKLTLPTDNADVFVTENAMGVWPWQAQDGITEDWYQLFHHYDIDPPTTSSNAYADNYPTWPPYCNTGVIITKDDSIPSRLLQYTETLFNNRVNTENDPAIETEQIAFALIMQDVDFAYLDPTQNYMMGSNLRVQDDVAVLHYLSFETLATLQNKTLRDQLHDLSVTLHPTRLDYAARLLGLVIFRGGRILPKEAVRWYNRNVFPPLLRGDQTDRVRLTF